MRAATERKELERRELAIEEAVRQELERTGNTSSFRCASAIEGATVTPAGSSYPSKLIGCSNRRVTSGTMGPSRRLSLQTASR